MDDVSIIVAQHNRQELTRGCLNSLAAHETAVWRAIVVDDGSSEPSSVDDASLAGRMQWIAQPHRGVTAAWNAGARAADDGWLIFLNNDVACSGAWIERLLRPLRRGRAVMTGPACRDEHAVPEDVL